MENYHSLIDRFWEYNAKEGIPATAIAFYLFLLKIWNSRGGNFMLTNREIMSEIRITEPTIIATREYLQKLGLIHFQTPKKTYKGVGTHYKIIFDYTIISDEKKAKKEKPKAVVAEEKPENPKELFIPEINTFPTNQTENITENLSAQNIEKIIEKPAKKTKEPAPMTATIEEVLSYVRTLPNYQSGFENRVKGRYMMWQQDGWKNANNKAINAENWTAHFMQAVNYMELEDKNKSLKNFNSFSVKTPRFNTTLPTEKPKMKQL